MKQVFLKTRKILTKIKLGSSKKKLINRLYNLSNRQPNENIVIKYESNYVVRNEYDVIERKSLWIKLNKVSVVGSVWRNNHKAHMKSDILKINLKLR